jgi:hypothetical protein
MNGRTACAVPGVAVAALLLAAAVVRPADAQSTPDDTIALATRYAEDYGLRDTLARMEQHYRDEVVGFWANRLHKQKDAMAATWETYIQPSFDARAGIFLASMTQVIARTFSPAELQSLIDFEESPVGRKMKALRPHLQDEMFAVELDYFRGTLHDAIKQHVDELHERGLNFPQ